MCAVLTMDGVLHIFPPIVSIKSATAIVVG